MKAFSAFAIRMRLTFFCLAISFVLQSCAYRSPELIGVDNFDVNRYLGDWYEIARLDNSFERHLQNVTASYSLRKDGGIDIVNSGSSSQTGRRSEARGRAYFADSKNIGHLEVSFFWPFYGAYVIFHLDCQYQYAFVTSNTRDYLWLLTRSPTPPQSIIDEFIAVSKNLGFDTDALVWVDHD